MNQKRILIGVIGSIALLMIVSIYQITNRYQYKLIPYWYVNKYIDKAYKQDMIIQKSQMAKVNQSKYKIVFPSFTDMSDGTDLFKMVTVDFEASLKTFVEKSKRKAEDQKDYFIAKDLEGRDDLIYITCIPWVSFTSLSHTISFNKDDSIPRLAWGKYYNEGDKVLLPFSIQAHHSFIDGIHMGQYIDYLQGYLNSFE